MDDQYFRLLFFVLMNIAMFGALYLFGRKSHPKLAPWLTGCSCIVMIVLCYFSVAWLMLSLLLSLVYLFILRKPNQKAAFQKLYAENKIYSTTKYSQAVLDKLGKRNWRFSEGKATTDSGEQVTYSLWQGSTSSTVSSGQYTRSTVHTYYLAFIFPHGTITDAFKKAAAMAADRSGDSWKLKLKYFFRADTERPFMIDTATDGSFIIQYITVPDVECYSRRIQWINDTILKTSPAAARYQYSRD